MLGFFKDAEIAKKDVLDNSFRPVTQADIEKAVADGMLVYQTDDEGLCTVWLSSADKLDAKIAADIIKETYKRQSIVIQEWDFKELGPTIAP